MFAVMVLALTEPFSPLGETVFYLRPGAMNKAKLLKTRRIDDSTARFEFTDR